MKQRLWRGVLLAAVLTSPAQAELLTRAQAIRYALEHNPELAATREQANAAEARRAAASGAQYPSLGLNLGARASNNPLDAFADKLNTRSTTSADFDPANLNHPGTSDLYWGQVALRYPIYAGGRVSAESEAARLAARAATLQFERARELTALHTLRAYTQVQLAEQGAVIAHEATDAARRHAQTTARLAREGRTVTADKLTAEVSLAAVESQQVQAQTRLEQARSQLKRVLGLAPDAELVVEPYPGAQVTVRPLPGAATPLENTALAARKDLQAVKLLAQAAAERVTAARALHKPKLDFVATHNRYDNTDAAASSSSVMGVVSLDLFAGGSHDAKIAEAAAEAKQAQWQERAAEQTVRAEVREAFEYYRDASRRHELAKGNVERARETVRQVETRYGQGRTILIDLLQAERGLSEARNEELQSRLSLETGAATLDTAQGKAVLAETTP